jgi:hypothetical protein
VYIHNIAISAKCGTGHCGVMYVWQNPNRIEGFTVYCGPDKMS